MKVVLLAGGYGTRLGEYTDVIPKPMVRIGDKPIIWHIMKTYSYFGYKDFYLALGYKAERIKDYFLNYRTMNADFEINLKSGSIKSHQSGHLDWNVMLINTGLNTMTGGRLKRMKSYINNETFMLTYGDGVSDIDLKKLYDFHKSHGKMATVTAVRPTARFGELQIENSKVLEFVEKPQLYEGWINGGFFIFEPEIFDLIQGDETLLEREPLELASKSGELMAYQHEGFWQCMDTKRDHELLEKMWNNNPPWKK